MSRTNFTIPLVHGLGLAVCLSLLGDLAMYAVLVTQLDFVWLSLAAAGLMLSVNRLIRIPGNPIVGLLLDRLGRRPLFLAGMALAVLTTSSYGLVRGFWPFLLARLAWGVAWMLINVGGRTMILDVSTPADRGRLLGLYHAWMWAGFAAGPLIGGLLTDLLGFRPAMFALAVLTAIGAAVAFVAVPETQFSSATAARGLGERATPPAPKLSATGVLGWIGPSRTGLVVIAVLFLATQFGGEGVVTSTLTWLVEQRFGSSFIVGGLALGAASAGGALLALHSLIAAAAGPLAGYLSDRRTGRRPVIAASLGFAMLGFALLTLDRSALTLILGVILLAFGSGAALAALTAQAGDLAPTGRRGTVMGVFATIGDAGLMAGPLVAFALAPTFGLRTVYLLCLAVFGAVLGWYCLRPVDTAPGSC
ncbi:MAG: MFS transporter [Chloroflexi bacterium]|nr:MFS transporter [Chloroflexota bacterium]